MDPLELLGELRAQAQSLPSRDEQALDALRRRAQMLIRRVFGAESKYLHDLGSIVFHSMLIPSSATGARMWGEGQAILVNLINTMEEELNLFGLTQPQDQKQGVELEQDRQVFIVHGHDEAMKQSVARSLETLLLDPIILHEQPNQGRTIIEKLSDHAQVQFAVVLLSPDDVGRPASAKAGSECPRARQNVVFELGYFLGNLGPDRVLTLYREEPNFEMPSDYSGVLFVPFDASQRWQFDLVRELQAAGYDVDANRLLSHRS